MAKVDWHSYNLFREELYLRRGISSYPKRTSPPSFPGGMIEAGGSTGSDRVRFSSRKGLEPVGLSRERRVEFSGPKDSQSAIRKCL